MPFTLLWQVNQNATSSYSQLAFPNASLYFTFSHMAHPIYLPPPLRALFIQTQPA